jgi:hypothetical protein
MDLKEYLELLKKDHPALRKYPTANVIPTRDIVLKVDVNKVRSLHIVPPSLDSLITSEMHLRLKGNGLEIKDLALLDILATADWERPVYVDITSLMQFNIDLSPFTVREGNTYRILPVINPDEQNDLVNTTKTYDNMMTKFQFRGLDDSTIYYSDDYRKAVQNHRFNFNSLAGALIAEGDYEKAKNILLTSLIKMPDKTIRYDVTGLQTLQLLMEVGEKERASDIADKLSQRADELIAYYIRVNDFGRALQLQLAIVREIARVYYAYGEKEKGKAAEAIYLKYMQGSDLKRREL